MRKDEAEKVGPAREKERRSKMGMEGTNGSERGEEGRGEDSRRWLCWSERKRDAAAPAYLRRCTRRGVSLAVAAAAAKWLTCRLRCGGWPAVPAFSPCLMRRLACLVQALWLLERPVEDGGAARCPRAAR